MRWFLISLINPITHAATNHIDKYLVDKYLKSAKVGSLVLFSCLFAVVTLPLIYYSHPDVTNISIGNALLLSINGTLIAIAYVCYLHALARDEASFVTPLFQVTPILGYILGYLILRETLSFIQIIGSIVIMFGAILLSFEISKELDQNKMQFKGKIVFFMLGASALYAINSVLFKFITNGQANFWRSVFWNFFGLVIAGVFIFLFSSQYRKQFLELLRNNHLPILLLNILNEVLALLGEGALAFAVLLAPIALVEVVGGIQPVLVFLFGIIITRYFPSFGEESMTKHKLTQKIAGIAIILFGTILINL